MANKSDVVIAYVAGISALVTPIANSVLTFSRLIDIPLVLRLVLVSVFGATFTLCVVLMLTAPVDHHVTGFGKNRAKPRFRRFVIFGKMLVVVLACGAVVALFNWTVTFHDMRLSQTVDAQDARAGKVELVPSHFASNVTMTLSTRQPNVKVKLAPRECGDTPLSSPNIEDQTDFGATYHLFEFKTPQRFCIAYRLLGRAEPPRAVAVPAVANVDVLTDRQVGSFRGISYAFGGILCAGSFLLFCYRYSWFRGRPN
jgi:hypothetical protein